MLLLAIDTATPATSVAVVDDGEVVAELRHVDARGHCEALAPLVVEALAVARTVPGQLTAVVVGVGPGAYTGLRVGIVTALSMADALAVPVHGVVSLDALAFGAGLGEPFAVVTDARRKEVFWARYADRVTRLSGPDVGRPDDVARAVTGLPVVGAAGTPFAGHFPDVRGPDLPSAGALGRVAAGRLASGGGLPLPQPMYLRRPDVTVSAGPRPVGRR